MPLRIFGPIFLVAISIGCSPPRSRDEPRVKASLPDPDTAAWSYRLKVDRDLKELHVSARFRTKTASELAVSREARDFVQDVEVRRGQGWQPAALRDGVWQTNDCANGCEVRYRFELGKAAEVLDDVDVAAFRANAVVAPPSTWLLRPQVEPSDAHYRFSLDGADGVDLVSGVWQQGTAHEAETRWLPMAPYSAFGHFDIQDLSIGGARVRIAIARGDIKLDREPLVSWVRNAAEATSSFYDGYPVPSALVLVLPEQGRVLHGKQLGTGGAAVLMTVGNRVQPSRLEHDWRATHEMTHLAVPDLARRHLWLSEGIASYVEPIARMRIGKLTEQEFWNDLIEGLPKGLPEPGDRGLDFTQTWGRTYWGGALFCIRADVELRKRTQNRKSLRDALIGVVRAGGTGAVRWPIERFMETADSATGQTVFQDLYREMRAAPAPIDLDAFWHELGVSRGQDGVLFDDSAPLAEVRRRLPRGE